MKLLDVGSVPKPKPRPAHKGFATLPKRKSHRYPNRYRWPIWFDGPPDPEDEAEMWDRGDPPWWTDDGAGLDNADGVW
jgi:hypothetical protein